MAGESTIKKTKGRQKIEMKKIENDEDKLITFSKRRSGIYKKASELAILTDAEIGFVVYSPAGKPFSFGHPSVEAISNRLLGRQGEIDDITNPLAKAHRLMRIDELNTHHNELLEKLDVVKKKEKQLKQMIRGIERNEWWDTPTEEFDTQQLFQMEATCKNIQMALISNVREMTGGVAVGSSSNIGQPLTNLQPAAPEQLSHMFYPFAANHNEPEEFHPTYGHKRPRHI